MTTLATDGFPTGALSANWTHIDVGFTAISNEASSATSVSLARYTGVAFPNDHWCQVTIGSINETTADAGPGPAICVQAGGNAIFLQCNVNETKIYERTAGPTYTQLGADGASVLVGSVMYLEIQGTTIIAKKNGVLLMTRTASGAVLGGNAGIWASPVAVTNKLDDFSAGDFLGGVVLNQILMGQACL